MEENEFSKGTLHNLKKKAEADRPFTLKKRVREQVAGMGIRVGKKLRMITKQPIKGPLVVVVDEASLSLGLDVAEKISVEVNE